MNSARSDCPPRRVLVVEDEYFLAVDLAEALEQEGFNVIGPAADLGAATNLALKEPTIHAALVDVNLRGELVWPVVNILQHRCVPMILTTGYNNSEIPASCAHLPTHQKPVAIRNLMHDLRELLTEAQKVHDVI